jgi:hypothetical protein
MMDAQEWDPRRLSEGYGNRCRNVMGTCVQHQVGRSQMSRRWWMGYSFATNAHRHFSQLVAGIVVKGFRLLASANTFIKGLSSVKVCLNLKYVSALD